MAKLRGYIVVICFLIFGIGTIVMGNIVFPLIKLLLPKKYKLNTYSSVIRQSWKFFVKFLIFIKIIDVKVKDIEKIKNIKNSIIVSTHPSFIDGVVLISLIPQTTCLVAERLSTNFITKNIVNTMFIISGKSLDSIVHDSVKMLDNNFNVLIFPSGRRHKANEYPKIRKGAALLAIKSKKDIVPIRLTTNTNFLQINEPVHKPVEKQVEYLVETLPKINVLDYINKYNDDELVQKREISKEISKQLYNK
jgi:1-acyl-sn-glycerol-3-phosphate acyltransferase